MWDEPLEVWSITFEDMEEPAASILCTKTEETTLPTSLHLHTTHITTADNPKSHTFTFIGPTASCKMPSAGVQRLATKRTGRCSSPGEGKFIRTGPDLLRGPHNLLEISYEGSSPGIKRPGRDVDHPPSNAEVKERVKFYI